MQIYFDEGFVDAIVADAKNAGKPIDEKTEAFLREIDGFNRAGVSDFQYSPEKAKEVSQLIAQVMVDNVKNFSETTKKEYSACLSKNLEEHGKFVEGAKEALEWFVSEGLAANKEVLNDYEANKPRIPDNVHGKRGPAGASDFINAGFSEKERYDIKSTMTNDARVAEAQGKALKEGNWITLTPEAAKENVMGLPEDQIYAPGHEPVQQAQEHVTGVNQTAPRLVEGTDVSYWVDDKGNMQIDAGDSRTPLQARGVVNKDLTERQKNGEELHPAEVQFMADYKQMAMSRGMRSNSGMSIA